MLSLGSHVASWLMRVLSSYMSTKMACRFRNSYAEPSAKIVDRSGVSQTSGTVVASNRFCVSWSTRPDK